MVNTIDSLHLKLRRRIKKKFVTLRENVEETNLRITSESKITPSEQEV